MYFSAVWYSCIMCFKNKYALRALIIEAPESSADPCDNITCWISAGGLAAIFSSVVIVLLLLVCLVAGCVFRQWRRKSKRKYATLL